MFTGIIQEMGSVKKFERSGGVYRMEISCDGMPGSAKIGDSIAVNGICLTVVDVGNNSVSFDVMEETVKRASLSGGFVNLEAALRMGDSLGGHIVQGHIDCVGKIKNVIDSRREVYMEISIDPAMAHLVVEKGSIAIDGISLTVGEVTDKSFKVYIIPHTLKITNLGKRKMGDLVNIEFDIVGKYIARSKELEKKGSGVSEELLRRAKFI